MKQFKFYQDQVGYDRDAKPPEITYKYAAYKDGKAVTFETKLLALSFSKNIEMIYDPESRKAFDEYWKNQKKLESKAADLWYDDLKEEYSDMKLGVFNVCYNKAYEQCHSDGYDSVASAMDDLVDFANEILEEMGIPK